MKSRYVLILVVCLTALAMTAALTGCAQQEEPAPVQEAVETPAPETQAEPVYTRDDPGAWEGKEQGHLPIITYEKTDAGLKVNVAVNHVMDAEIPHYIMWIKLFDGEGNLLGQKEFEATSEKAEATFELTSAPAKLVAHEKCNVHGIWMEQVDVS